MILLITKTSISDRRDKGGTLSLLVRSVVKCVRACVLHITVTSRALTIQYTEYYARLPTIRYGVAGTFKTPTSYFIPMAGVGEEGAY